MKESRSEFFSTCIIEPVHTVQYSSSSHLPASCLSRIPADEAHGSSLATQTEACMGLPLHPADMQIQVGMERRTPMIDPCCWIWGTSPQGTTSPKASCHHPGRPHHPTLCPERCCPCTPSLACTDSCTWQNRWQSWQTGHTSQVDMTIPMGASS